MMASRLIREVNQECGQAETSSDEEEDTSAAGTIFLSGRNQQQQVQQQQRQVAPKVQIMAPDSPDFNRTSVLETFAPRSLLQAPVVASNGSPGNDSNLLHRVSVVLYFHLLIDMVWQNTSIYKLLESDMGNFPW